MTKRPSKLLHRTPSQGRKYPMGRIASKFLADGNETGGKYSISEWWLDAHTKGPGPHSHDEDDVFYVLEGTMSFLFGKKWIKADRGSFVLIPGGTVHDFENRSSKRAGALNFSIPGNFEESMPGISAWFKKHPPGDAVDPAPRAKRGKAKPRHTTSRSSR